MSEYMDAPASKPVKWYRTPLPKEVLKELTERSDLKGVLQTGGVLLLLAATAVASILAVGRLPAGAVIALVFLHGTFYGFIGSGFHELTHGTMFRSKRLNALFLRIYAFLSWHNHVHYRQSHMRHHVSTLHQPEDLEVTLPIHLHLRGFLLGAVVDPVLLFTTVRGVARLALGRLHGEWDHALFDADPDNRRRLFRWARITLLGHLVIVVGGIATGLWMLPVVTTLGRFYGGWAQWLCGYTQHIGLKDSVPDFRLCCRSLKLNPLFRFLYFHMNYHADHHMYAAVPCYNLARLHRAIAHDTPPILGGLIPAWREIAMILRRQQTDPGYQHVYELPRRATA